MRRSPTFFVSASRAACGRKVFAYPQTKRSPMSLVSRVTVRKAMELLSRDGVAEVRQGSGTFITGAVRRDPFLRVETTLADLAEGYRDTSPQILNISEARSDAPLLPSEGKSAKTYILMRRVHSRDDRQLLDLNLSRRGHFSEIAETI